MDLRDPMQTDRLRPDAVLSPLDGADDPAPLGPFALIPRQDEWDRVYAVGDVHGRLDLMIALEDKIRADLDRQPVPRPLICYLGDLIDRGPDSRAVIDHLIDPPDDGVARLALLGNHEQRMLDFLGDPAVGPAWLKLGGRQALRSYGASISERPSAKDFVRLRRALLAALPESHSCFLRSRPRALAWRNFVLVHAGIDPARPLLRQRPDDLIWIRAPFLSATNDFGAIVVHGHVMVDRPDVKSNRIAIDTGAWKTGHLTCVVLDDDAGRNAPRFLST
ncbi:MAG: metallophosphoesterase [Azospirillaceae bacterium]|nr:metallophosphoesterase [Azospirillaceae bacterium]